MSQGSWNLNEEEDEDADVPVPVRRKYAKRIREGQAHELPAEEGNATVIELFPNQCAVRLDGGAERRLAGYRLSGLSMAGVSRERSPVCVGDRVRLEAGVIVGRCARRNQLVRSAPNSRDPLLHAIVANVDCLVVVAAASEPEFTAGIVDRFLVAAHSQAIASVLCVNKSDLLLPGTYKPWLHYPEAGVALLEASARSGEGVDTLAALLRGKTAVFCGHSGVGKTSLLRRLIGDATFGRVGKLSGGTGMGRHTTTGAVLLPAAGGSTWIDTPGIMNFTLVGVEREGLLQHFPELARAAALCPKNCRHDEEPGCFLPALPRWRSYRQILASLKSSAP